MFLFDVSANVDIDNTEIRVCLSDLVMCPVISRTDQIQRERKIKTSKACVARPMLETIRGREKIVD